jgi:signal-transduction protein with cAMP-binding, CBS, and nucleotidyltransferase domain
MPERLPKEVFMATIRKHVTREMVALDGTSQIRDAARLMAEKRIGSIAVREGGRIVGLVTERDLMLSVCAAGKEPGRPIRDVMRQGLPRVHASATEIEVSGLMRDNVTRHLLVEEGGEVVGVVSMRDIIQLMLDEKQYLIEQLETYIEGR